MNKKKKEPVHITVGISSWKLKNLVANADRNVIKKKDVFLINYEHFIYHISSKFLNDFQRQKLDILVKESEAALAA